jgi:hypothetical protein
MPEETPPKPADLPPTNADVVRRIEALEKKIAEAEASGRVKPEVVQALEERLAALYARLEEKKETPKPKTAPKEGDEYDDWFFSH